MVERERAVELEALTARLGIEIAALELIDRALTHASLTAEDSDVLYDYESLEFLGDAALGLAIAHYLFEHKPDRTPGEYSRLRANLVNRKSLATVADRLGIASAIRLGKGEELSGGRRRSALLADCLEALMGAVYLDKGWEIARQFIIRIFSGELAHAIATDVGWDYKSRLQHHCQAERIPLPNFEVVKSEGPDHQKRFEIEVYVRGQAAGRGNGLSKKEAEQNAARDALQRLGVKHHPKH